MPSGYVLTTRAYRAFIIANCLEAQIQAALPIAADDPQALETASATIRALFTAAGIPAELTQAARQAYRSLGSLPV